MGDWQPDETAGSIPRRLHQLLVHRAPVDHSGPRGRDLQDAARRSDVQTAVQMLSETMRTADRTVPIEGARIGEDITFKAGGRNTAGG